MELLFKDEGNEVWFELLQPPYSFSAPFDGEDFVCLLVINNEHITTDEQVALSAALVESGCRYACCTGNDCSSWDDSIDIAYLETDKDFNPPDERFVMTTWHDNESMESTINFFLNCTQFDDNLFSKRIVLFLGIDEEKKKEVIEAILANKEEQKKYLAVRENRV